MSYYDGGVLKPHKIHDGGPDWERFNLAIFSEGYRYDQLGQFVLDANVLVDRLFTTRPFDQLRCSINVYRLDIWSLDAGADDPYLPPNCPGTGATPRTFFDASFCGLGIERLIVVDSALVEWVRWHHLPQAHEIMILVNATKEGGNGDTHAVVSKGGGWDWPKVILHELGHSAFGLGDEYDFLYACDDEQTTYQGPEPEWPNVAKDIDRETIKWAGLVASSTPLPTKANPDCATCDTSPSGYPPGTVGAFEGAGLFHCGLYRSQDTCLMRYGDDYCAVCSAAVEETLSPFEPRCLAPVFEGSSGLTCLFKWLIFLFVLAALTLVSGPGAACTKQRLLFRLQRCGSGNEDPCIDLGSSP